MDAVATSLRAYRDGKNPDQERLSDSELARRLGVSKSTVSKYLKGKQFIGGEPLARIFTELDLSLILGSKEISARNFAGDSQRSEPAAEQICFVFERPCFVEETPERLGVAMASTPVGRRVTVHLKIAS